MFNIERFRGFCRENYNVDLGPYGDVRNCPLCKFLAGEYPDRDIVVGGTTFDVGDSLDIPLPPEIIVTLDECFLNDLPLTGENLLRHMPKEFMNV